MSINSTTSEMTRCSDCYVVGASIRESKKEGHSKKQVTKQNDVGYLLLSNHPFFFSSETMSFLSPIVRLRCLMPCSIAATVAVVEMLHHDFIRQDCQCTRRNRPYKIDAHSIVESS